MSVQHIRQVFSGFSPPRVRFSTMASRVGSILDNLVLDKFFSRTSVFLCVNCRSTKLHIQTFHSQERKWAHLETTIPHRQSHSAPKIKWNLGLLMRRIYSNHQQQSDPSMLCYVVRSRWLMPPDARQPKAYCTNPGLQSFLPGREMAGNFDRKLRLPRIHFRVLLHAANRRHGTNGFNSLPKEGVLRIFSPWKIRWLQPGLNPAKLGTQGQHATSRPPKPLSKWYFTWRPVFLCDIISLKSA